MKNFLCSFITLLLLLLAGDVALAQTATVSYPFAIGRNSNCGNSGTQQLHYYTYNGTTNTIANASGGMLNSGVPQLRIGNYGGGSQRYTSTYASVSFNPKDHKIYYFWTAQAGVDPAALTPGGISRTYAWSWPVGTIPTSTSPRLDTIRSFPADILGVAFDNAGNGYDIEFTSALPTSPPTYKPLIRSLNFTTGAIGGADTLALTGGAKIYQQGSGDVAISPSGQMFFVVDNKLFTPNYTAYTGTAANLTCTYIDTVKTTGNFVGLTYAEGEAIAAFSGTVAGVQCPFQQITLLTAANTPITKFGGTVASASDMASVVSGLGSAKKLVSVVPTGTPLQYDVQYDVFVQNYGNMDVLNVQVTDDLTSINGNANVAFISAVFTSNPAGMVLNPAYNGKTNINLLNGTGTLVNYPTANNNFTIRITCRLSNIQNGIVYNNSAIATGRDWVNNNLRDSSTNGSLPDLNTNDKPDDVGEGQPTPLIIAITPQTPPCASLTNILYAQDFGTGTGLSSAIPAPTVAIGVTFANATTTYTGGTVQPVPLDGFTLTNNAQLGNTAQWISLTDHTGNANGRMLAVNADVSSKYIYSGRFVYSLCPNQQYSLSFYAAFTGNSAYQTLCGGFGGFKYPKIKIRVRDVISGGIISEVSTADITNTTWQQFGLKFVAPTSYNGLYLELINDAPGGCGNDLVVDDIQFGTCDPLPVVNVAAVAAGCIGSSTTFTSSLSDPGALPGSKDYQWQISTDNATWVNIVGATSANYTIASIAAADTGKYYRVIIAATGNIAIATCSYKSPGTKLNGKVSSLAATGATKDKNNVCPGKAVVLGITGGTLGTGANWVWYAGSCTGTVVGTGSSITVNPTLPTTYYVRAEGDCNITSCVAVSVFISCDIDKDKDGIPDYVESYIPAATANAFNTSYPAYKDNNGDFINDDFQADGDSDGDGIPNYKDTDFPGRIDANGDTVDDRFDYDLDGVINMLDLDSDNDGIPDVVEAGGVDADGDGKIDNFTDTDGDGLSQNVDANNTGANISGNGLGSLDTDGDGRPNTIDLDSDNDGIPDVREVLATDANNDGIIDGFVDVNKDGLHDSYLGAAGLLRTGADGNSDGKADSYPNKNMDNDSKPNPYDLDSDGDGIVDVLEARFADANFDGIIDGAIGATTGWSTVVDAMPTLTITNTDTRGNPDFLDIDADDDGIPDNIEGQPTNSYKFPAYADADGDGIDDAYDLVAGFGGSGILLSDKDVDGIPDYRDLDTDADGQPDIVEGNDFNRNGIADDNVALTLLDTDGDGLDNRFDSLTSMISLKGTSYNMGTGGGTAGDVAPGARCPVQKTVATQTDRDWRYTSYVLNVKLLQLSGVLRNDITTLNWNIITTTAVDKFEIERSTDNINFSKIQTLVKDVPLNVAQAYTTNDDLTGINSEYVFYRLKVTTHGGQITYSNVLLIKKTVVKKTMITVHPNPAADYVTIGFYADKEYEATIKLMDNIGKVVVLQKQHVLKGTNSIPLTGLSRFSNATYILQVILNDQVVTQKLLIQNR